MHYVVRYSFTWHALEVTVTLFLFFGVLFDNNNVFFARKGVACTYVAFVVHVSILYVKRNS